MEQAVGVMVHRWDGLLHVVLCREGAIVLIRLDWIRLARLTLANSEQGALHLLR